MNDYGIKPFLCDTIDKSLIRLEWEKWLRSFSLFLKSEEVVDVVKKKNKLLHLGGPQLQEVIFNIPGALIDNPEDGDMFEVLVNKLNEYFSPKRNSTFERHLFRSLKPEQGESLNKFLVRLRNQTAKCSFGKTQAEIVDITIKDKLIDVWAPGDLQKRLLEKEYSLSEIIEMCQVHEQIKCQTEAMSSTSSSNDINKISSVSTSKYAGNKTECFRCGRVGHLGDASCCPARNLKCNRCGRLGHFSKTCRTKTFKRKDTWLENSVAKRRRLEPSKIRFVEEGCNTKSNGLTEHDCFQVSDDVKEPMSGRIDCFIGGNKVSMLIDSGSRFNLIGEDDWECLRQSSTILGNFRTESENQFRAYAGNELLKVLCVFEAPISVNNHVEHIASFYVIKNGKQSLLGRETAIKLKVLKLGVEVNNLDDLCPFPKIKGIQIHLSIDNSVRPVQQPMRRIPSALEEKVGKKLKEAVEQDIIEPVYGPSLWISPIVIVFKETGDIRLCIDMRRANNAILRENYPLPTFDSFLTKLKGAKYFSRLDLKSAYHQLELDEDSRQITTFITHKGLFRYKRLLFGVNSAPEIFQRVMENILAPCRNALNYLDDVIIFGLTEEEHNKELEAVIKIFREMNVTLNDEKCSWKVQQLKFLGHVLSTAGISADPDKIKSVLEFRAPNTKEETRSFLGLVTYLGKFIPDMADVTEPLWNLIKKDVKFTWGEKQAKAFQMLKDALVKIPTLSYFNPTSRTRLIADASPVALGAVLLQFKDGNPEVISFASKSLSAVEKRYSQTEKESLALVWATERFYYYLAGIEFELVTDHKPLEAIFKPTSKPPARIERWVLRLQSFKFKVIYQAGKSNIADSLSRLCKLEESSSFDKLCEHNVHAIIEKMVPCALTITEIVQNNSKDKELMEAVENLKKEEWNANNKNGFFPFRMELCTLGNILLRGTRIVIPLDLRSQVLNLAHEGHPGETAMKRRLRAKVWWPGIDRDVVNFVKSCRECLLVSQPTRPVPMKRHVFPDGPWECLAMDLLGPLPNNDFVFVIIDYYSRYQESKFLKKITTAEIITILEEIFCRLGYPKSIKADNGRQFVSGEFKAYCKTNNIDLITSPPYWPQANGEVENMNRSILKRLQIANANGSDYKKEIQKFILMYNVTPHSTTGKAPSELLFNRVIRDKIPSVQDISEDILDSEARDLDAINKEKGKQKGDNNRKAKPSEIDIGDKVLLRNVVFQNKLTPTFDSTEFEVIEKTQNEVVVRADDGKVFRRNISHVKKIPALTESGPEQLPDGGDDPQPPVEDRNLDDPKNGEIKLKLKNIGGMWRSENY